MRISLRKPGASEWTSKCICESHVDWLKFEDLSNRDEQDGLGKIRNIVPEEYTHVITTQVYRWMQRSELVVLTMATRKRDRPTEGFYCNLERGVPRKAEKVRPKIPNKMD